MLVGLVSTELPMAGRPLPSLLSPSKRLIVGAAHGRLHLTACFTVPEGYVYREPSSGCFVSMALLLPRLPTSCLSSSLGKFAVVRKYPEAVSRETLAEARPMFHVKPWPTFEFFWLL